MAPLYVRVRRHSHPFKLSRSSGMGSNLRVVGCKTSGAAMYPRGATHSACCCAAGRLATSRLYRPGQSNQLLRAGDRRDQELQRLVGHMHVPPLQLWMGKLPGRSAVLRVGKGRGVEPGVHCGMRGAVVCRLWAGLWTRQLVVPWQIGSKLHAHPCASHVQHCVWVHGGGIFDHKGVDCLVFYRPQFWCALLAVKQSVSMQACQQHSRCVGRLPCNIPPGLPRAFVRRILLTCCWTVYCKVQERAAGAHRQSLPTSWPLHGGCTPRRPTGTPHHTGAVVVQPLCACMTQLQRPLGLALESLRASAVVRVQRVAC
jgi:hypothetical protein